ncbi:MAG: arginyltransferase [Campylobacterales bacterium]
MNFLPGSTFITRDKPCPYLNDKLTTTLYRFDGVDANAYEKLIERGWRRFGRLFFMPMCSGCDRCISLRIDTERFEMSRSFKRVLKTGEAIRLSIRRPTLSDAHLSLYGRYHAHRHESRGWQFEPTGSAEYYQAFVEGARDYGYEFAYYLGDRLIAVALVDILPRAISAVYCYYDPDYTHLSLGTYSILRQILAARKANIRYLYLGYWVPENRSLSYKSRFKPYETLQGRPTLDDPAVWVGS